MTNHSMPGDENGSATEVQVYIFLEVLIALLAILGNTLVCWAVWLNSNLQNATNYFVVSLAAADIAVGVLAIPFAITISTGFCALFHGCLFIACFVLVLTQSSIFSLLAIAIDRYIAIRIPLRYNGLVTSQRANGIIAICWVLSFIIGLTPMLGWHNRNEEESNCTKPMVTCLFEKVVTMDYMVYFNFFACVLGPLLLMLGIYLKIFMAARRQLKQMELNILHGERSRSILQKELHAAKSLAIIVGLFAFCWLPLHTINCVTLFCPKCTRPPLWLMNLAIILSHFNSVVNPLIYAYRIREFRHTFRKIIKQNILGRKDQLRPSNASIMTTTSTDGDRTDNRVNGYILNICPSRDQDAALNKTKEVLEWSTVVEKNTGQVSDSSQSTDSCRVCPKRSSAPYIQQAANGS
uniref:Adenosine receptor A2 n=1 Tax=Geotrypetes seraphini TaxID=260995 RepID=A0A6P8S5N0_GEOSA|nr:adenosine receptor A2a [Geotrypetes seraphini]XP_033813357.1 adenosine receptor A2a [Geotrypetes seraphini]XP_033813358.1 adenosine receptor A2a [Geotrypetes seraphini]XP_033813359.1 adenosine receptor A2a [Geotrypetes seraphini]XP_033813360.1 adenosine receptor A2a [Geotrypetes seraphini]